MRHNKNSPYNFTEEDITLIMQDPTHLHKLMGGNGKDSAEFKIPGRKVNQKDNSLLRNDTVDAYLKKRMPNEKYEDFKKRWNLERNKPVGQARDSLLEKQILMEGLIKKFKESKSEPPAKAAKNLIKKYLIE